MRRDWKPPAGQPATGFTLIELMIVVAIIGLLLAILGPAIARAMEIARQVKCRAQLKAIHDSVLTYTNSHDGKLPLAAGITVKFAAAGSSRNVQPTEAGQTPVSAMLWQVLKSTGLPTKIVVCPSAAHRADPTDLQDENVWDFLGGDNLSYAVQHPLGSRTYLGRANLQAAEMPVLADRGPYLGDGGDLGRMPNGSADEIKTWLSNPANRGRVNSANHGGLGQNVIFADGHGEWCDDPLVGLSRDNIYSWQADDTAVGRMKGVAPAAGGSQEPFSLRDTLLVH